MRRQVLQTVALVISICTCPGWLGAQITASKDPNPALWQATPDAVALGGVARDYLGFGSTGSDGSWFGSAGFSLGGGMLRASYGQESLSRAWLRNYGLGYARRVAEAGGGLFGTWGMGVDLSAAYQSGPTWASNARAARLSLPLSVRWGSPSGFSFAPYIAPYAEYGHAAIAQFSDCGGQPCPFGNALLMGSTRSTGLGFGANLTLWRLGFTIGAMGVPQGLGKYANGRYTTSAGVTLRF